MKYWHNCKEKNNEKHLHYTGSFHIFVRINLLAMDTKLTLKLDKAVIERAKEYALSNNRSLSRIIESYLQSLTIKGDSINNKTDIEISPFVRSMSSGIQIPADLDYKNDYSNYLTEKYK
jgi:hypothetical protein